MALRGVGLGGGSCVWIGLVWIGLVWYCDIILLLCWVRQMERRIGSEDSSDRF
jgi:hypothetical protein